MPELELEKVFLGGGGGGGDLPDFSDPCLAKLSVGFVATVLEGLAGFSITGFGSFSGPFWPGLSE